ncbi:YrdB family protein [Radiobacillus sp. PE A8.2]|uniref:YrdB family protein n=1 Tax=Radiobacillus sp. PE A8.2 TaxID=3380349 RepID=UPI00388E77C1
MTIRFLLEIAVLIAVGYCGFQSGTLFIKVILGLGSPVLIMIIWGLFGSPKATYLWHGWYHFVLELFILV